MENHAKKSMFKEWWFYFVLIIFAVVVYLIFPKGGGTYGQLDNFATCLTDSGAVMYGTEWCPHCKNQKALFGSSFKKINYVDCDFRSEECLRALVTGYPTWKVNGQNYPGEQSLEKLALISGCELSIQE